MIPEIPLWAAVLVALLVVGGGLLGLLGALGLVRGQTFYDRAHPPTIVTSLGMSGILFGSLVYFSVTKQRASVHEILLIVMVTLVTPITMMLLARAAIFRDRSRGYEEELASSQRAADELAEAEEEAARRPSPPAEPDPEPPG